MSWIFAFLALFTTDVCWALYVKKVNDGALLPAAVWAVLLFLTGAGAVIGYTTDHWLLIPSAAGAFAGTYVGAWMGKK